MPLAFSSHSHGTIAFGFFNIEIDMLLLEQHFFFADRFCTAVGRLHEAAASAAEDRRVIETELPGYQVEADATGNVNGAIRGWDLSGFIGASYRQFPFPSEPAGFKQKPYGSRNQPWAAETMPEFGREETLTLRLDRARRQTAVGKVIFGNEAFAELIDYVDRGGYPRWQDETRPPYVSEMMRQLKDGSPWPLP